MLADCLGLPKGLQIPSPVAMTSVEANLPVQVWFILVHVDIVERVHSEPSVESETILVRPLCNGR